jgi:hypothetical protein
MLSTWRILNPVAQDNPLALCDYRSIQSEDLIATDRVIPGRAGEVYYVRYNKSQRWVRKYMVEDEFDVSNDSA